MIWLPYKVTLAVTNFVMLCFLVVLMVDHYASNYNIKSWSTVFHCLSFGWLSLRGAFWLLTIGSSSNWGDFSFYILYWVPCPLEFGSFLLLPIFFAQILYPKEWKVYWKIVCSLYGVVIVGLTCFMISWAVLREKFDIRCAMDGQCVYVEYTSNPLRAVTAVCFLFLAAVQAAYGLKLVYMRKWQFLRFYISSPGTLAAVNVTLVLSFLSRAVYQILFMCEAVRMPKLPLENDTDMSLPLLCIFMFWDYIPLALIIMTVTSTSVSAAIPSRVAALFRASRLNYRSINAESGTADGQRNLPFSYNTSQQLQNKDCDDKHRSPNSIKSGCKEISPLLSSGNSSSSNSPRLGRQNDGAMCTPNTLLRYGDSPYFPQICGSRLAVTWGGDDDRYFISSSSKSVRPRLSFVLTKNLLLSPSTSCTRWESF